MMLPPTHDGPSREPTVLECHGLAQGPFTASMAQEAGLARPSVRRLLAEGLISMPLRGAFLPTHLDDSLELRAGCLALVVGEHVVLADRTAAWLWGVSAYSLADEAARVPIDAFSRNRGNRVRRGGVHSGSRGLMAHDVVDLHGLTVTSPLRTAIDLACGLRRLEAVAAVDALMRCHGISRQDLKRELARFRGRRGVVQAREVVDLVDSRSESSGESFLRVIIVDEGFPSPEPQVWVHDERGRPVYRVDLAYEALKIAIEYDGEKHHTSVEDRRRDTERRAWLRSQGWEIIVVTKRDLAVHRRGRWLDRLQALRAERLELLRLARSRPLQRADRLTRDQLPSR